MASRSRPRSSAPRSRRGRRGPGARRARDRRRGGAARPAGRSRRRSTTRSSWSARRLVPRTARRERDRRQAGGQALEQLDLRPSAVGDGTERDRGGGEVGAQVRRPSPVATRRSPRSRSATFPTTTKVKRSVRSASRRTQVRPARLAAMGAPTNRATGRSGRPSPRRAWPRAPPRWRGRSARYRLRSGPSTDPRRIEPVALDGLGAVAGLTATTRVGQADRARLRSAAWRTQGERSAIDAPARAHEANFAASRCGRLDEGQVRRQAANLRDVPRELDDGEVRPCEQFAQGARAGETQGGARGHGRAHPRPAGGLQHHPRPRWAIE